MPHRHDHAVGTYLADLAGRHDGTTQHVLRTPFRTHANWLTGDEANGLRRTAAYLTRAAGSTTASCPSTLLPLAVTLLGRARAYSDALTLAENPNTCPQSRADHDALSAAARVALPPLVFGPTLTGARVVPDTRTTRASACVSRDELAHPITFLAARFDEAAVTAQSVVAQAQRAVAPPSG